MTLIRPDAATLDAMVTGVVEEEPEDTNAWEWLIGDPEGVAAWEEAVVYRRKVDQLALSLLRHPWLASLVETVVRRRTPSRSPWLPPSLTLQPVEAGAAMLGPSDASSDEPGTIPWGRIVTRSLSVGQTVHFEVPAPASGYRVLRAYWYGGGHGWLQEEGWKLEKGEAPVLLLAGVVSESSRVADMDALLTEARALAVGVLVEAG
jgi:hypothetical protein